MSKKLKRILLSIAIAVAVIVLALLFLQARHHYIHSARADDIEGLKACITKEYKDLFTPGSEVIDFGGFCEASDHEMAALIAYREDGREEYCRYVCLPRDELFKNRCYAGGGGGTELNKLTADCQFDGDKCYVYIYGMKLENIGAKFEIYELHYSGEVTDENYFDVVVLENPIVTPPSYDIHYLSE